MESSATSKSSSQQPSLYSLKRQLAFLTKEIASIKHLLGAKDAYPERVLCGQSYSESLSSRLEQLETLTKQGKEPNKALIVLIMKIVEALQQGPRSEKEIREYVARQCVLEGLKPTSRGSIAGANLEVGAACSILSSLRLLEPHTGGSAQGAEARGEDTVGLLLGSLRERWGRILTAHSNSSRGEGGSGGMSSAGTGTGEGGHVQGEGEVEGDLLDLLMERIGGGKEGPGEEGEGREGGGEEEGRGEGGEENDEGAAEGEEGEEPGEMEEGVRSSLAERGEAVPSSLSSLPAPSTAPFSLPPSLTAQGQQKGPSASRLWRLRGEKGGEGEGVSAWRLLIDVRGALERWGGACFEEGRRREVEEQLGRELGRACGLPLSLSSAPPLSPSPLHVGTRYLKGERGGAGLGEGGGGAGLGGKGAQRAGGLGTLGHRGGESPPLCLLSHEKHLTSQALLSKVLSSKRQRAGPLALSAPAPSSVERQLLHSGSSAGVLGSVGVGTFSGGAVDRAGKASERARREYWRGRDALQREREEGVGGAGERGLPLPPAPSSLSLPLTGPPTPSAFPAQGNNNSKGKRSHLRPPNSIGEPLSLAEYMLSLPASAPLLPLAPPSSSSSFPAPSSSSSSSLLPPPLPPLLLALPSPAALPSLSLLMKRYSRPLSLVSYAPPPPAPSGPAASLPRSRHLLDLLLTTLPVPWGDIAREFAPLKEEAGADPEGGTVGGDPAHSSNSNYIGGEDPPSFSSSLPCATVPPSLSLPASQGDPSPSLPKPLGTAHGNNNASLPPPPTPPSPPVLAPSGAPALSSNILSRKRSLSQMEDLAQGSNNTGNGLVTVLRRRPSVDVFAPSFKDLSAHNNNIAQSSEGGYKLVSPAPLSSLSAARQGGREGAGEEEEEEEDIGDLRMLSLHEQQLQAMRERWALIHQLKVETRGQPARRGGAITGGGGGSRAGAGGGEPSSSSVRHYRTYGESALSLSEPLGDREGDGDGGAGLGGGAVGEVEGVERRVTKKRGRPPKLSKLHPHTHNNSNTHNDSMNNSSNNNHNNNNNSGHALALST